MDTSVGAGKVPTVDADGHVLEPRDVWQRYLEPGLRDRAIRIERDADGWKLCSSTGGRTPGCAVASARSAASAWTRRTS